MSRGIHRDCRRVGKRLKLASTATGDLLLLNCQPKKDGVDVLLVTEIEEVLDAKRSLRAGGDAFVDLLG